MQPDMDITFCIPKPWGDEDQSFLKIIGVCNVPIVWRDVDMEHVKNRLSKFMDPQKYFEYRDHIYADFSYRHVNDLGCMEFSGRYPDNLLEEINNYSIVAGVIARTEQYDIIHAHDWLTYPAGIHAKNVSGKPLVIHVHATDYDRSRGNVNPDVYAIEKNGMDNADHIMTVSNLTRQTVIEKYHQDPSKVTTVHNAVEPLSQEILSIQDKKYIDTTWFDFQAEYGSTLGLEHNISLKDAVMYAGEDFCGRQHDALVDARNTAGLFGIVRDEAKCQKTLQHVIEALKPKDDFSLGDLFDFSALSFSA